MDFAEFNLESFSPTKKNKEFENINPQHQYDVVIIGGGPAGCSAAIYALRKNLSVAMISENIGGQIIDTSILENYLGIPTIEGEAFAAKLKEHLNTLPLHLKLGSLVQSIKKNDGFEILYDENLLVRSKSVILATGARYRRMGLPLEEKYIGNGISFCATCDAPIYKDLDVIVVGCGNSGAESALELSRIAETVTILEFSDIPKADPILLDEIEKATNVSLHCSQEITEIIEENDNFQGFIVKHRHQNTIQEYRADGAFIQIGLLPNSHLELPANVEKDSLNQIISDHTKTKVKGFFVAGDVSNTREKQVIIAASHGAQAALEAYHFIFSLEN